jgi:hypothetical protein
MESNDFSLFTFYFSLPVPQLFFEALILVIGLERSKERTKVAFDNPVKTVECQVDPVVGHAILGKIIGANALATVARPAQIESRLAEFGIFRLSALIKDTRLEYAERFILVPVLGALILTLRDQAGRQMGQTNGRIGSIHALTATAT